MISSSIWYMRRVLFLSTSFHRSGLTTGGAWIRGHEIALNVSITKGLLRRAHSYSVSFILHSLFQPYINTLTEHRNVLYKMWHHVGQSDFHFDHFLSPCVPQQLQTEACLIMLCWHTFMFFLEFASDKLKTRHINEKGKKKEEPETKEEGWQTLVESGECALYLLKSYSGGMWWKVVGSSASGALDFSLPVEDSSSCSAPSCSSGSSDH